MLTGEGGAPRAKFAVDSLLEEAVTSEPVSTIRRVEWGDGFGVIMGVSGS
jgi:hypothetical protein